MIKIPIKEQLEPIDLGLYLNPGDHFLCGFRPKLLMKITNFSHQIEEWSTQAPIAWTLALEEV